MAFSHAHAMSGPLLRNMYLSSHQQYIFLLYTCPPNFVYWFLTSTTHPCFSLHWALAYPCHLKYQTILVQEIRGSHSNEGVNVAPPDCNTVWIYRKIMFRKDKLPPSSGVKMQAVHTSKMLICPFESSELQPRRPTSTSWWSAVITVYFLTVPVQHVYTYQFPQLNISCLVIIGFIKHIRTNLTESRK
jgi:hypothetical protein